MAKSTLDIQLLIDHLGNSRGIGYWVLDLVENDLYWSEQLFVVHGVSPEEYTPSMDTAILLYHPEDREEIQRRVSHVFETKTLVTGVSRIITGAGEIRWIHATLDCKTDDDGNPVALFGTAKDINKERVAEYQYEMALSTAKIGLWNWDLARNTIQGNQQSHEIGEGAGVAEGDIIHTFESFLSRVHEADRDYVDSELNKLKTDDTLIHDIEFRYQITPGVFRWIRSVGKVVEWFSDNRPLRVIGLIIDIHENKLAQEELRRAYEKAEHANRARGEFLANMSHEVRTPMNGILGLTEVLLETPLNEEQKEYSGLIKRSGQALLHILNDILDFSKIESGKLELSPIVFSLNDFVHDLERLYLNPETKKQHFVVHIDPDLPTHLIGDPYRLRQVVGNLLSNAVKFTPEHGSITFSVELKEQMGNQFNLLISVKDSGIGIAQEKQALIFEAFRQADTSTTREYGGSGLGLAISAKLVEQMGGSIWVESTPGNGAAFMFTVNLKAGQPARKTTNNRSNTAFRALDILVAEDNFVNQKLINKMLTNEGHLISLAHNGQEAIDQFSQNTYDIVLMDIQMPVMNGVDAMRKIRDLPNGPSTPIMALTAHALTGDEDRYLAAGFDGYLSKPINKGELLHLITSMTSVSESSTP